MKEKTNLITSLFMLIIGLMIVLSSCGKGDSKIPDSVDVSSEPVIEEKSYLSAQTRISYSAGNDSNWSYVNQRKEFSNFEACYVRIGSTAITSNFFGKGVDDEITITYRFSGAEHCMIEISDGKVTRVEIGDPNVFEFTRTINAEKENNAEESIAIFRYMPEGAESVALEVIYDDQVAEKYDSLSTIYFDEIPDSQNGIN